MNNGKFAITRALNEYVEELVTTAYPELGGREIVANWSRMKAFATVTMNRKGPVKIQCNRMVRAWPEPALIGLLSHELSHRIIGNTPDSERITDEDVIKRGLGVYLAVERVHADRYLDNGVGRKQDKYLGYQSIRNLLSSHEIQQLDRLLVDLGLII